MFGVGKGQLHEIKRTLKGVRIVLTISMARNFPLTAIWKTGNAVTCIATIFQPQC
jgi:hypothetical protein